MEHFKSMFDGWTKQIYGSVHNGMGGHCAIGWLDDRNGSRAYWDDPRFIAIAERIKATYTPTNPVSRFT